MYKFDYHMHTNYSTDSFETMKNVIETSIKKGFNEISITDHLDFFDDGKIYTPGYSYDDYFEIFMYYQNLYKEKIRLTFGIEAGLTPKSVTQINSFLSKYPFDFIIGSSHMWHGEEIYISENFYLNNTKDEAYQSYFEEVLEDIKLFDKFCVFGHLDYIRRYGIFSENSLDYDDFKEIIDKILVALIEKGKGLEINTSGYRYNLNQVHPQLKILKRYKELGGEILTVGSDAHAAKNIGDDFDKAYAVAKEAGFKKLALFRNLKPEFIDF